MQKTRKHIRGRDAANMEVESNNRGPLFIEPSPGEGATSVPEITGAAGLGPASRETAVSHPEARRKRPPRLRKPSPLNDQCLAPTADLDGHQAALRQAFGDTLSDEFLSVLLGKLIAVLRPGPNDKLDEATLNAAIAVF